MTPPWVPARLASHGGSADPEAGWPEEVSGVDPTDDASVDRLRTLAILREFPPAARDVLFDLALCWLETYPRRCRLEWSDLREIARTNPTRAARAWNEALAFTYGMIS